MSTSVSESTYSTHMPTSRGILTLKDISTLVPVYYVVEKEHDSHTIDTNTSLSKDSNLNSTSIHPQVVQEVLEATFSALLCDVYMLAVQWCLFETIKYSFKIRACHTHHNVLSIAEDCCRKAPVLVCYLALRKRIILNYRHSSFTWV